MKVLFIDDSYRKGSKYLGNGGFCIDIEKFHGIVSDFIEIKHDLCIPDEVEIKWSPDRNTFLSHFAKRRELYGKIVSLIEKYSGTVFCAVYDLKDCYGYKLHGWSIEKTKLWATTQQLKQIIERFETPCLNQVRVQGIIISDKYGSKKGDEELLKQVYDDIRNGTDYRDFHNVCLTVTTVSKYCVPLQIADAIIGIIVSSLDGSPYGLEHFEAAAKCFLKDPHEGAASFTSTISGSTLGFGLKLFPDNFMAQGYKLFEELDKKFIYANGLIVRNPNSTASSI